MGFFDKVKISVTGVSEQQRYAAAIRKITAQIQNNEKEIARLTEQVGIQCVKLHLEETGTEYENFFAVIRQYLAENQASEQEIQRLKEQQEAEENARRQALMEKEEADRIARQQTQEAKAAKAAARQQMQAEKTAWGAAGSTAPAGFQQQTFQNAQTFQQQSFQQQPYQNVQAAAMKACPVCGGQNEMDAMFCVHCGSSLAAPETKEESQEVTQDVL